MLMAKELRLAGINTLSGLEILDVGCGSGAYLLRFLQWGAQPERIHGLEVLADRVQQARALNPLFDIVEGNASELPWSAGVFDVVSQFTAFSSILESRVRLDVAGEIDRTLKPRGLVMWYDFWTNPINPDTRGVTAREVRRLFPGYRVALHRTTPAPPIARPIAEMSWQLGRVIQGNWPMLTHLVGILVKPPDRES